MRLTLRTLVLTLAVVATFGAPPASAGKGKPPANTGLQTVRAGGGGSSVSVTATSQTSTAGSGRAANPGATVSTNGGGGGSVSGPRITRTKREIVYDYSHLGGGEMHYVFDDTRDYCHGSVNVAFCYGPKPKPVKGKPGRGEPVPPPLSPTDVVEQTIVNVQLPGPRPQVDPGYAVTGLRAYLETGNSTRHTFAPIGTVLGPLSITASSTYTVNWGDGTTTGPHTSNGGAYPDGDITHVYRDAETVDITVTQNWTAQWSLAGQSGTISGLSSSGGLPNFVVREVQAVRER